MNELGPEAREILHRGRDGDDPLPADRARIHSALMATIAAGAATSVAHSANAATDLGLPASVGTAKPVATSIFGSVFAKGILILFVGGAGVGAWLASSETNTNRPAELHHIPDNVVSPENQAPIEHPIAAEEVPEIPPAPQPVESALGFPAKPPSVHVTPSAPAVKAPEESADSIIAETRRLREAHGAMREGDPEKALALLSDHAAEDEGQKLREERAAARVLALCKLGRVDEAHAEAAAFLAQNPQSPLADRVRNACPKSP